MRKILIAIALMMATTCAYAQSKKAYKPPQAGSLQTCIDIGNMANRMIYDRFKTNDMQTSMKTLVGLQERLTEIAGAEAANAMIGVMLEDMTAAYRLPYTPDDAAQRVVAEKFIRERLDSCAEMITRK